MIQIFPYNHWNKDMEEYIMYSGSSELKDFLLKEPLFFENGKAAIHYIARLLNLTKTDQVTIYTATDNNYVSTCVTGTLFNYCSISRVMSKNTKAIYVIHEFGKVHPEMIQLINRAKELNIPIIEDCAHTFDSCNDTYCAGSLADFTIYSLPKIFPVKKGGILIGKNIEKGILNHNMSVNEEIKKEFLHFFPAREYLSNRRKENYLLLKNLFYDFVLPFTFHKNETPYFFIMKDIKTGAWTQQFDNVLAEFGRTYIKDWICIPTQPLCNSNEFINLYNKITNNE